MADIIKQNADTIATISESRLAAVVFDMAKYIALDVGIKGEVDDYLKKRFIGIIQKYFYDLTLSQIKEAFELSLVGKLDDFLPRGSNNTPDRGHYQMFSAEYVTKILTAYRRYLITTTVNKPLELAEHTVTEAEKANIHNTFIECIYADFEAYRDGKKRPFIIEKLVYEKLVASGLIDPDSEIEVNPDEIMFNLTMKNIYASEWEMKAAVNARKAGGTTPLLDRELKVAAMAAKITSAYQMLIMDEKHISEVILKATI